MHNIMEKAHLYFVRRWLFSSIIMTLPGYWFYFLRFFGRRFDFLDVNDSLTNAGVFVTILIFAASFGLTFSKNYTEYRIQEEIENNEFILRQLLSGIKRLCSARLSIITNDIRLQTCREKDSIDHSAQQIPRFTINEIIDELKICFEKTMGIDRSCIAISILYKYCELSSWQWFYYDQTDGCETVDNMINNKQSHIHQVIYNKGSMFYAKKQTAYKNHKYVYNDKDLSSYYIGSIVCRDISVQIEGQKRVQAVISISTYGHNLCQEDNSAAQSIIEKNILPTFEDQIKIELASAYIKDLSK